MTSTPVVLLLKRSGLASDRPSGVVVQNGELALSAGASDPGLYFEDTAGNIRKIGPAGYGTSAPNSTPVGQAGNSVGELWTDSTGGDYYLKVWTGGAWVKVYAGFADSATTANSALTAGTATFATRSSTAVLASGAILASGALTSNSSILSSGSLLASGAVLASGALTSNSSILSSGSLLASGAVRGSQVVFSGLPDPLTSVSGELYYQIQTSGIFAAGLYVRALDTWLLT